jgi:2-alkyl-3-oxoalkanoate reductase
MQICCSYKPVAMHVLVTGATGFLGGALARRLHANGFAVTAFGRNTAAGSCLQAQGIRFIQGDLRDAAAVDNACSGQQAVFHCGAKVDAWGAYADFYTVNVQGATHIVESCWRHQISRLIHVSTPSIYCNYQSRLDITEDAPLPVRPVNAYAATKLLAEGVVDRAQKQGLFTLTLRPRAIFGPGDTQIFPRMIQRLQQRRLPVVGDGTTLTDLSYIDNVVDALLLCLDAPATVQGRKYNISNGEPVQLWEKLYALCQQLHCPLPRWRLSYGFAFAMAAILETAYSALRHNQEPPLTRYTVSLLARSMTLNIEAARRDLGYQPKVSVDEGLDRYVAWRRTHGL